MIHKCRIYRAGLCARAHVAVISRLNGLNEGRAPLLRKNWRTCERVTERDQVFLLAAPPGIDEKAASADLPQLELDYLPTTTTLLNGRGRQAGRVKKDCWELNWDWEHQPEEDVRRNF